MGADGGFTYQEPLSAAFPDLCYALAFPPSLAATSYNATFSVKCCQISVR